MNILFISRATLFVTRGGDTVQIENTAAALRLLGVHVDFELCNNKEINYKAYDLIHFFNIIRPADIIYHIDKSKLPFVMSPIYVEYKEQARYSIQSVQNRMLSMLNKNSQEYVKCVARSIKNKERIVSKKYLYLGHKRAIKYILEKCSHLLPNSESEYRRIKEDFHNARDYTIVPNAVNNNIFKITADKLSEKQPLSVLCVARFEPQKNQLNTIKALSDTVYTVKFVGNIAPNHHAYYQLCKEYAGGNISFEPFTDQQTIATLYRQYKVHILPSWFETTGLSSLEAAACGCNIVVSKKGDTEEYFTNNAIYCDPGNVESIKSAVDKAMTADINLAFMENIKEHYNWNVTAKRTFEVYQKVIKR
jgi:glycosyltransferase involved in cell wall biosynthesis